MARSRWPSPGEIRERMAREPDTLGAASDQVDAALIQASVEWLEAFTNWRPFLGENSTYSFDPPRRYGSRGAVLNLNRGLLSTSSIYWGSACLVRDVDWMPGVMIGEAITTIRIISIRDLRLTTRITITGRWGLMERPSAAAWEAVACHVMGQAVAIQHSEFASAQAGGWREGDRSVNSPKGAGLDIGASLIARAEHFAKTLVRVGVG